jgi:hypothetical protein
MMPATMPMARMMNKVRAGVMARMAEVSIAERETSLANWLCVREFLAPHRLAAMRFWAVMETFRGLLVLAWQGR